MPRTTWLFVYYIHYSFIWCLDQQKPCATKHSLVCTDWTTLLNNLCVLCLLVYNLYCSYQIISLFIMMVWLKQSHFINFFICSYSHFPFSPFKLYILGNFDQLIFNLCRVMLFVCEMTSCCLLKLSIPLQQFTQRKKWHMF